MKMNVKKTLLSVAIAGAMGVSAAAQADTITGSWAGWFTMLTPAGGSGGSIQANSDSTDPTMGTDRTWITGTLSFDTATGAGSGTVVPFSFGGGGLAAATGVSFQAIGDGGCSTVTSTCGAAPGPGPLVLGNMGFDWNGTFGISISIVLDASGFFGAVGGGLTVSQTITGGVLGRSDDSAGAGKQMGPAVMATTRYNTTNVVSPVPLGTNPSGTLPLIYDTAAEGNANTAYTDGIGGSPMRNGPFTGYNGNFDIMSVHVTSCVDTGTGTDACQVVPEVPVPAAVWLFGSGLLGLVGIARRKKRSA
jgi:hypothetical protein